MTKTRNTVMNGEANETEKGKGTKKGKKTKTDNSKQLELPSLNYLSWLPTNIHKTGCKNTLL